MNLAMVLPWIQVTFECYDNIRMPYMEKRFDAGMEGLTYVMLAYDWKKGTFLERGTSCEEEVTIEVSTGMNGRVILTGKSQREKTVWWYRL